MRRIIWKGLGRLAGSALLAGIAVAGTAAAATAQPPSAGSVRPLLGGAFHQIKNSGNGLCLERLVHEC